jgi:hypothetical protein
LPKQIERTEAREKQLAMLGPVMDSTSRSSPLSESPLIWTRRLSALGFLRVIWCVHKHHAGVPSIQILRGVPPGEVPATVTIITILILASQTRQWIGRVATGTDMPLMLAVFFNLN